MSIRDAVQFPGTGCIVELMQGNSPLLAVVTGTQGEKLRLFTLGKKETTLSPSRLLPWFGPVLPGNGSALPDRATMSRYLDEAFRKRSLLREEVLPQELWELAEGEVNRATAGWFASLVWDPVSVDHVAAMGHALMEHKTHFRFNSPDFEVHSAETVEKRLHEAEQKRLHELVVLQGNTFFHKLWASSHAGRAGQAEPVLNQPGLNQSGPTPSAPTQSAPGEPSGPQAGQSFFALVPDRDLSEKLQSMLFKQIQEPEAEDALWKQVVKGLPADPHLPLFLAQAWGLVPEHYNYLLDRAGYERGDDWAEPHTPAVEALGQRLRVILPTLPEDRTPFACIDPAGTVERDDAFWVQCHGDGSATVKVAVACPSLVWPYGEAMDQAVSRRASSLYLPEGDERMMPHDLGRTLFSLDENKERAAFVLSVQIDAEGKPVEASPYIARIQVAHALSLEEAEAHFATSPLYGPTPEAGQDLEKAGCGAMLHDAYRLALALKEWRLRQGAVITERPEAEIRVDMGTWPPVVILEQAPATEAAHLVVGELMVMANTALAVWAGEQGIPLFYRTQDVGLPKEFSGVWKTPQDISRVVRSLPPAILQTVPRRHAGLAVPAYTTCTSPIRRYTDLINQGQITHFLLHGSPVYSQEALQKMLPVVQARADAAQHIQRTRPRYWKYVFFAQKGDREWWSGVISDENSNFVTVSLPWAQLAVRGRRKLFGDKCAPGTAVEIRLGKVAPLKGDIAILEAREVDTALEDAELFFQDAGLFPFEEE